MYTIIGADGNQYGPVSAEQVREWIAQNRLNEQTRIKPVEAPEWTALGNLPEFADALKAKAAPGPLPSFASSASGFSGQQEADALAAQIVQQDYDLDIGSCVSRGWELVLANFWPSVGAGLIAFLLVSAVNSVPIAGLLLTFPIVAGLDWYFLKLIRGEPAEIGDIFASFQKAFLPLMLLSIVGQLLTLLGFILCILPGIYLAVIWLMFPPLLIMDKRLDFWPAMELSRKVVNRHWWLILGFNLVCLALLLVGTLVCLVGFLVAFPVTTAATVYAYEDIFGRKTGAVAALPPA